MLERHAAGDRAAEATGRAAIADLVEAFLLDRLSHASLFARAHRLGALLDSTVGCRWKADPHEYTLSCPIYALHRTWATSVAMTTTTRCSACGAGDLQCEHVPGRVYDGERCRRVAEAIGEMGHVAFTADPDFSYTWYRDEKLPVAELLADGTIAKAGDPAFCRHCNQCAGIHGASPGDLDPVGRFLDMQARAAVGDAGNDGDAASGPPELPGR